MIRRVEKNDIHEVGELIRTSFATVAKEFGITKENSPTHTSFITDETLTRQLEERRDMFVMTINNRIVGYFSLDKTGDTSYELKNLVVAARNRHNGYGRMLVDYARDVVKGLGGKKISIGIINENEVLKKWYESLGFTFLGSHKFEHMVFTAGFMELTL